MRPAGALYHVATMASDEELMRAYVAGDEAAFRTLFDRYVPQLMRLARRRLDSDEQAREVVQQTFFQLHVARHDFREGARLRPWLFTIAMNLVREHHRRRGRRRETSLEPQLHAAPAPARGPVESEQRAARLRAALRKLPESQREVVELHWFREMPFAEVAGVVGASEVAVRVRAHRAYRRLEAILREELE